MRKTVLISLSYFVINKQAPNELLLLNIHIRLYLSSNSISDTSVH